MSAPSTRLIKGRNVTGAVTANADIMFLPGGDINNWVRRLQNATERFTAQAAPSNKRPRWGHHGAPLKRTIKGSAMKPRSTAAGMRIYAAVGSTAPYAVYVDQGTGVYAGGSPYPAKILPPWKARGFWLWEHTWRPPGSDRPLGPKMIQGQRKKEFFDAGLRRAFAFMVNRGAQIPENPVKMGQALRSWPSGMENFLGGATPAGDAFTSSLKEWRKERDAAFARDPKMRQSVREQMNPDLAARRRRQREQLTERAKSRQKDRVQRRASPYERRAAATRIREGLEAKGFVVIRLRLNKDGTWLALVRRKGGEPTPARGTW